MAQQGIVDGMLCPICSGEVECVGRYHSCVDCGYDGHASVEMKELVERKAAQ